VRNEHAQSARFGREAPAASPFRQGATVVLHAAIAGIELRARADQPPFGRSFEKHGRPQQLVQTGCGGRNKLNRSMCFRSPPLSASAAQAGRIG